MVLSEDPSHTQQASNALVDEVATNIEMGEEPRTVEESEKATINPKKRKNTERRSLHWQGYTVVEIEEGDPPIKRAKAQCNRCGTLIAADTYKNGTTGLKNHSQKCLKKHQEASGQKLLSLQPGGVTDGTGSLISWRFDPVESRLALTEMIILDELPFKFVEREGFRKFVARICPQFVIPSRKTIREDCVKLFVERRESLKSFFRRKGIGRVSITTDCWTAINNTNFICVTAHCIGKDWALHKKIISFRKIVSHKGDDIGDSIVETLNEWDLQKIMCCTVDNASANDGAVKYISSFLDLWKTNILGGKYLHLRCTAHIINLVVSEGLEEIGMSVRRVREAVKWIKASPKRIDKFNNCVTAFKIDCKKWLALDVPTRWNSTYLMLESAEPYEAAFKLYGSMNTEFVDELNQKKYKEQPVGPPQDDDWVNVRKMMEYLKSFYDLTLLVSSTTYVTSHLFFKEMCDIFDLISELEKNVDVEISLMANKMMKKIGKYWSEAKELNPRLNKILFIAALLDPRQKLKHVEKCLKKVYGIVRGNELATDVKESMNEVFDFYKKQLTPPPLISRASLTTSTADTGASTAVHTQRRSDRRGSMRILEDSSDEEPDDSDISELTIYLSEKQHKEPKVGNQINVVDTFDILQWWSKNGMRYPVLSEMARDILAIPISTVASESAFSTGGRVLDSFRSSLTPSMVEALICAEDWLKSTLSYTTVEEEKPEEEQEQEYNEVLLSVGFGGENEAIENPTGSQTTGRTDTRKSGI